jgi:cytochrome c oxidase assembly protein subunit 15
MIDRRLALRLVAILALGGAQGALGWWMVKSGLVDRPDVSPFRLAAHLGLAVLLYILVFRTALQLWRPVTVGPGATTATARVALVLAFVQLLFGALVAGLDAGLIYNTWPLMDGQVAPLHLMGTYDPLWLDPFENAATAQFQHRMMAFAVVAAVLVLWWRARDTVWAGIALGAVLIQAGLGIATLLLVVPLPLAALHQFGAIALITCLLCQAHFARVPV